MRLYDSNGYLDFNQISKIRTPFILIVGARGIGKTYGALKYVVENEICFALMRRTKIQVEMIRTPEASPFKPLILDTGCCADLKPINKELSGVYGEDSKLLGYVIALSTIANLRGFSGQDIEWLVYDEFIPEKHERPIRSEETAFLNAYETINRNRELQGRPPLKCICMANSNDVDNAVFRALGLVGVAVKMLERKQELYINDKRGVTIIMPQGSPISEAKRQTALYRAAQNDNFSEMALDNDFSNNDFRNVKSLPLAGYIPLAATNSFYIYQHKSGAGYYLSSVKNDAKYYDLGSIPGYENFRLDLSYLYWEYIAGGVTFESYDIKSLFLKIFDKKS